MENRRRRLRPHWRIGKVDRNMMRILAAAAALLAFASAPARAQDYVVIESSVPGLAVGATFGAGAALAIPEQGRVVFVNANGEVTTITGPYRGALPLAKGAAAAGSDDMVKLIATLMGSGDQRQTTGVVRAATVAWREDTAHAPADVMAIDASDGGDTCLYDKSRALVAHNPADDGAMTIEDMNGGGKAALQWPKNTAEMPWPAALPLSDGASYLFERPGADDAVVAVIHVLDAVAGASAVARAAQMAKAGCSAQARLLLALVAKSAK
jgi:hypothetical protein